MSDRINQVRQRCAEVFGNARRIYGVSLQNVQIRFDLRGRTAGMAGYKTVMGQRRLYLRFNVDLIANDGFKHIFEDTVPHEIAHLVCYENPSLGSNHDNGWRRVCRQLGGSGERCHQEEVTYANGHTYEYVTSNGKTVLFSQIRHRKIQKGTVYRFKNGWGHVDSNSKWKILNRSSNRIQQKTTVPAEQNSIGSTDSVESIIKLARSRGIDMESVVTAVSIKLAMNIVAARALVKEHWSMM